MKHLLFGIIEKISNNTNIITGFFYFFLHIIMFIEIGFLTTSRINNLHFVLEHMFMYERATPMLWFLIIGFFLWYAVLTIFAISIKKLINLTIKTQQLILNTKELGIQNHDKYNNRYEKLILKLALHTPPKQKQPPRRKI